MTGGQEMKQSTKADEVRALLAALDRQLTKEGFFLHTVRFNRENDSDTPNIVLSYEEMDSDTDKSDISEADK